MFLNKSIVSKKKAINAALSIFMAVSPIMQTASSYAAEKSAEVFYYKSPTQLSFEGYLHGELSLDEMLIQIIDVKEGHDFIARQNEVRMIVASLKVQNKFDTESQNRVKALTVALNDYVRIQGRNGRIIDTATTAFVTGALVLTGAGLASKLEPVAKTVVGTKLVANRMGQVATATAKEVDAALIQADNLFIQFWNNVASVTLPARQNLAEGLSYLFGSPMVKDGVVVAKETAGLTAEVINSIINAGKASAARVSARISLNAAQRASFAPIRQATGLIFVDGVDLIKGNVTVNLATINQTAGLSWLNTAAEGLKYSVTKDGSTMYFILNNSTLFKTSNPTVIKSTLAKVNLAKAMKNGDVTVVNFFKGDSDVTRAMIGTQLVKDFAQSTALGLTTGTRRTMQYTLNHSAAVETLTGAALGGAAGYLVYRVGLMEVLDNPIEKVAGPLTSLNRDQIADALRGLDTMNTNLVKKQ